MECQKLYFGKYIFLAESSTVLHGADLYEKNTLNYGEV